MGKPDVESRPGMSAYAFFVQAFREEYKKKHPNENLVFAEFARKCVERWKSISHVEQKQFHDMAENDKKRYQHEVTNSEQYKRRKALKGPSPPGSAFFWFCQEERPKVKDANAEWEVVEIAKELNRRWSEVPKDEKSKYEALATEDKARYAKEIEAHKGKKAKTSPVKENANIKKECCDDEEEEESKDEETEQENDEGDNSGSEDDKASAIKSSTYAKPRGRMSAYAFFVQTRREEHKKEHPDENFVFVEFSKQCADRWKSMSDEQKKQFHDMAEKDKQRYEKEMANYKPPVREQWKRKIPARPLVNTVKHRSDAKPRGGVSAYVLFVQTFRKGYIKNHPNENFAECAKKCAELWQSMSEKDKQQFRDMAEKSN